MTLCRRSWMGTWTCQQLLVPTPVRDLEESALADSAGAVAGAGGGAVAVAGAGAAAIAVP